MHNMVDYAMTTYAQGMVLISIPVTKHSQSKFVTNIINQYYLILSITLNTDCQT